MLTKQRAMCKIASVAAALGTLLLASACTNGAPASLAGLKEVFHDPGFAVQGKTRRDQVWISTTQETGIRVLGWKRPPALKKISPLRKEPPVAARPPAARPPSPASFVPPPSHAPAKPAASARSMPHEPTLSERLDEQLRMLNQKLDRLKP